MKYLSLITLLAVLFISVFGFATMHHEAMRVEGMRGDCVASVLNQIACPQSGFAMVAHHISEYQMFLGVRLISNFSLLVVILVVAFLSLILLEIPVLSALTIFILNYFRRITFLQPHSFFKQNTHSWLSLFELSPAF